MPALPLSRKDDAASAQHRAKLRRAEAILARGLRAVSFSALLCRCAHAPAVLASKWLLLAWPCILLDGYELVWPVIRSQWSVAGG